MTTQGFRAEHRHELRYVFGAERAEEARQHLLHPSSGLRRAFAPRRVNDLYYDRLVEPAEAAGRLWTDVRFRWYGDESAACGLVELKVVTGDLACKVVQHVDRLVDVAALDAGALHGALGLSTRGFVRLELRRRPVAALYASSLREYFASKDGRIAVTLDTAVRSDRPPATGRLGGPERLPPTGNAILELHASQVHGARLQALAVALPFEPAAADVAPRSTLLA